MIAPELTDPFDQFRAWYSRAGKESVWRRLLTYLYPPAVIHQPDAMTIATVDATGKPSARVVLFKGIEDGGFTFYTNYSSQKGRELSENPRAALVFHWAFPERQVRIEGMARKLSRQANEAYWRSRPRGSQLSGSASPQSAIIGSRDELSMRVREVQKQMGNGEIPCPESWGGFSVVC